MDAKAWLRDSSEPILLLPEEAINLAASISYRLHAKKCYLETRIVGLFFDQGWRTEYIIWVDSGKWDLIELEGDKEILLFQDESNKWESNYDEKDELPEMPIFSSGVNKIRPVHLKGELDDSYKGPFVREIVRLPVYLCDHNFSVEMKEIEDMIVPYTIRKHTGNFDDMKVAFECLLDVVLK